MRVNFETENINFIAEFNSTLCAKEIIGHLPITSVVSCWGDEIYCDIGFKASADNSSMDVETGDIAYWSQGKSLCVFFGPTPASNTGKPVPASPVVIVGRTDVSAEKLKRIRMRDRIRVSLFD